VIEQLQYDATTSRYNFPKIISQMELQDLLAELSLSSIHYARGKTFIPYEREFFPQIGEQFQHRETKDLKKNALSTLLIPLKPIQDGTTVIGIDVSSIRIGETETGVICAVRGAVVWTERRRHKYVRIGPFPFYVDEENKYEIFRKVDVEPLFSRVSKNSIVSEAHRYLCNLIERWIQANVSRMVFGNIILWDGSLNAGMPGNPNKEVAQILKDAERNSNSVLAFSKDTSVKFLGRKITSLIERYRPPCLFEVEDLPLSLSKSIYRFGRVYVAKLSKIGSPFRLDIDRNLSREEGIRAVERLLGNELNYQGYPETLRLAHIHSTFTSTDVIGIQAFLLRRCGLKMVMRHDIRRTLFGPYGTYRED
jgi:hypothetical protein